MAAAVGKGSAQNINSVYFKLMLRKAYHRKSSNRPDTVGDSSVKLNGGSSGEEELEVKAGRKNNNVVESFVNVRGSGNYHHHHQDRSRNDEINGTDDDVTWVPDNRTGIYHPKGQEKVMEDVSPIAAKDLGVNWFSHP